MIYGISGKKNAGKDTVTSIIQYLLWKKDVEEGLKGISNVNLEDFERVGESLSGWKRVRFTDKLKDCVCLILGCTRSQLEDRDFKEKELGEEWRIKTISYMDIVRQTITNPTPYQVYDIQCKYPVSYEESTSTLTPRKILQLLGTECGRQIIHPNIWVNATMADYQPIHYGKDLDPFASNKDNLKKVTSIVYPNWIISDVRFPNEVEAIKKVGGKLIRVIRPGDIPTSNHISETALDSYTNWQYLVVNDGTINKELIDKVAIILKCENLL